MDIDVSAFGIDYNGEMFFRDTHTVEIYCLKFGRMLFVDTLHRHQSVTWLLQLCAAVNICQQTYIGR